MIDLVVVAGYFCVMLAIGWRARRGTPEAYWVASRQSGTARISASLVATIFGASSTVGIIGLGYSRGLTGAWWSLVGGLALIPFGLFLAARVRRLGVYTLPDILKEAYGRKVSVLGGIVIAVAWCGVVAAQLVAGALLLESVLSLGLNGALSAVTAVFVLYTLWGGQLSVIRTDFWQLLLFIGGLLAIIVLVLGSGLPGGGLVAGIPDGHLEFPVTNGFGWYQVLVFYPLIVGLPYLVGPDIYSRVLCARDEATATRAALSAASLVIPLSFLLAGLGLLIRFQFPGLSPESALPAAITGLAPAGLKGLIVVGILGAIMSSADTTLISAATILSLNVLGSGAAGDRTHQLRMTRLLVLLLGAVAWGIATFQQGIIASLLLAYTVFVGGVALPTLASFWREQLGVTPGGAFWAVALGGGTALVSEVGDGFLLRFLVGEKGVGVLEMMLGPEFGALLPLVVSLIVLLGQGRVLTGGRRRGTRTWRENGR